LQDKGSVGTVVGPVDLLTVEFGQKNQCQGVVYVRRSVREYIADANSELVLMKPGGVVQTCEWKEFDADLWKGRSRPELAVSSGEDFIQIRKQREGSGKFH
jgi:hypothetical protein